MKRLEDFTPEQQAVLVALKEPRGLTDLTKMLDLNEPTIKAAMQELEANNYIIIRYKVGAERYVSVTEEMNEEMQRNPLAPEPQDAMFEPIPLKTGQSKN